MAPLISDLEEHLEWKKMTLPAVTSGTVPFWSSVDLRWFCPDMAGYVCDPSSEVEREGLRFKVRLSHLMRPCLNREDVMMQTCDSAWEIEAEGPRVQTELSCATATQHPATVLTLHLVLMPVIIFP